MTTKVLDRTSSNLDMAQLLVLVSQLNASLASAVSALQTVRSENFESLKKDRIVEETSVQAHMNSTLATLVQRLTLEKNELVLKLKAAEDLAAQTQTVAPTPERKPKWALDCSSSLPFQFDVVDEACPRFLILNTCVQGAGAGHRFSNYVAGLTRALERNMTYITCDNPFAQYTEGMNKYFGVPKGHLTISEVQARYGAAEGTSSKCNTITRVNEQWDNFNPYEVMKTVIRAKVNHALLCSKITFPESLSYHSINVMWHIRAGDLLNYLDGATALKKYKNIFNSLTKTLDSIAHAPAMKHYLYATEPNRNLDALKSVLPPVDTIVRMGQTLLPSAASNPITSMEGERGIVICSC